MSLFHKLINDVHLTDSYPKSPSIHWLGMVILLVISVMTIVAVMPSDVHMKIETT